MLYVVVAAVTIALAWQVKRTIPSNPYYVTRQQLMNKICLAAIFAILVLLAALRVGVGNDYNTYIQNAHELYVGGYTITEPGYNAVVKALYAMAGGEEYLLIFAVFAVFTVFIFLKAMYEQSDDFAISFFLFMMLGVYFRSFNTVRYYFALAVTLYSLRYVVKREYLKFVVIILLAALFHKSVLVVIPLYFIASFRWNKWFISLIAVGSVVMFGARDIVLDIALRLYPTYRDTIYLTQNVGFRDNLPSLIRCLAVLVLCIPFYRKMISNRRDNMLYFNLNLMAIAMYVSCYYIPLITRFGYYLITAQLFLIANVLHELIESRNVRLRLILAASAMFCLIYFGYFIGTADREGTAVLPYRTWIMTDHTWVNDEENIIYSSRSVRSGGKNNTDTE